MLLSRSLKLSGLICAVLVPMMVGACDRQTASPTQPEASSGASTGAAATAVAEPVGAIDRTHKGDPLPAITVTDPAGQKLALASLKGKPVLLNLWATWCAPCVAELPTLNALAGTGTVRVVTISQDQETQRVPGFLKAKGGPQLTPWLDPRADLSFHFGGATLPTTVLYDSAGKEVWRFGGGNNWSGPAAAKLVAEAR